jgi:hypothetical protein
MEYEHGERGHYDYVFENVTAEMAEFGLLKTSCDCSKVEFAFLDDGQWAKWEQAQKKRRPAERPSAAATSDFPWKAMTVDDKTGVPVPGNAKGLVRVSWLSRKSEGQGLRLTVNLWSQPLGKPVARDYVSLETGSVIVAPVMFSSAGVSVGTLTANGTAQQQLFCWSATRDKLDLKIGVDDPRFTWKVSPLSPKECKFLEGTIRGFVKGPDRFPGVDLETDTRVRVAFRVLVTVYENKDGKQMDQGPFHEFMPVRLDGASLARAPMVRGKVQGEVDVGPADAQGKLDLGSFHAKSGARKSIVLWTNRGTILSLANHNPETLKVRLTENEKDSTPERKSWRLLVEVPAGSQAGPMPDDSAIILRTQSTPPRQIRIPILGTAVQG